MDVVISSALAVHLVREEAGRRFEQQAQDGHSGAEAEPVFIRQVERRVEDPEVDDVGQHRHDHPHQELVAGRGGGEERQTG